MQWFARVGVVALLDYPGRETLTTWEDLLPFFSQLSTHDKRHILLPNGGHMLILEKDTAAPNMMY